MFGKNKLTDLADSIDALLLNTEQREALASNPVARAQAYLAKPMLDDVHLPEQRPMNYALMSGDYREALILISAYARGGHKGSFTDFMANLGDAGREEVVEAHLRELPNRYYR